MYILDKDRSLQIYLGQLGDGEHFCPKSLHHYTSLPPANPPPPPKKK